MKWIVTERFNLLIFLGINLIIVSLLGMVFSLDVISIGTTYIIIGFMIMIFYDWKVVEKSK